MQISTAAVTRTAIQIINAIFFNSINSSTGGHKITEQILYWILKIFMMRNYCSFPVFVAHIVHRIAYDSL